MSGSVESREDWAPVLDASDRGDWLKWGWNGETGEAVVWPVAGAGDGRPGHDEYLTEKWGRPPSVERGDVLGLAHWVVRGETGRRDEVAVDTYYSAKVPASVVAALSAACPRATITVAA